ncbi:MAG: metallophosphoesterase [Muribaculaceae bacterium]|nr:metallophosphoesterase [Muribaculaceae bacterium]
MRMHWWPLALFVTACIGIDIFIFRQLARRGNRIWAWVHATASAVLMLSLVVMIWLIRQPDGGNGSFLAVMWLLWAFFTGYVPKVIGLLFYPLSRRLAVGVGAAVAAVMLWGALVTPRCIDVNEVTIHSDRLPEAFDGLRIVHFSDAHLGTYGNDTAIVSRFVDRINELDADVVCFTGDLVSRTSDEALPHRSVLSRLKARHGIYAVLGNHDYDDYVPGITQEQKMADRKALCQLEQTAGWQLLNDDHRYLVRGNDSIAIIGTENYGDPPFPIYGSFTRAYPTLRDSLFKVCLQHNPYAWRATVLKETNIDLMLAGHTHAMQFMLSCGSWRWSPAVWRYKEWGGLYDEGQQHLYVNIGMGMVGVPMRVGATPEITVITLKRKK